jgi:hypothetical protein
MNVGVFPHNLNNLHRDMIGPNIAVLGHVLFFPILNGSRRGSPHSSGETRRTLSTSRRI